MTIKTVRIRIDGRVQGIGFRAFASRKGQELDLDGWVRNRADGSVEVLASGPAEAVNAMIEACREGPPLAWVRSVEVEAEPLPPPGKGFRQAPSQ